MKYRLTAVQAALLRGIRTLLDEVAESAADAPAIIIDRVDSEPWASLTFLGERHELALRLLPSGHDRLMLETRLRDLAEAMPPQVPGSFVAEMTFEIGAGSAAYTTIRVEALTIRE